MPSAREQRHDEQLGIAAQLAKKSDDLDGFRRAYVSPEKARVELLVPDVLWVKHCVEPYESQVQKTHRVRELALPHVHSRPRAEGSNDIIYSDKTTRTGHYKERHKRTVRTHPSAICSGDGTLKLEWRRACIDETGDITVREGEGGREANATKREGEP